MEQPIFAAMLSVKATELSDNEKRILEKSNPLGITLFNRNIANKIQLKKLIKDIKETIGRDNVLIGIDQEGGRVRRLKEPEYPSYAGQQTLGRLYQEINPQTAREATHLQTKLIAQDLSEAGINLNYSPCIDLLHKDTSEVLRSRIFSNEPASWASYSRSGVCNSARRRRLMPSATERYGVMVMAVSEKGMFLIRYVVTFNPYVKHNLLIDFMKGCRPQVILRGNVAIAFQTPRLAKLLPVFLIMFRRMAV